MNKALFINTTLIPNCFVSKSCFRFAVPIILVRKHKTYVKMQTKHESSLIFIFFQISDARHPCSFRVLPMGRFLSLERILLLSWSSWSAWANDCDFQFWEREDLWRSLSLAATVYVPIAHRPDSYWQELFKRRGIEPQSGGLVQRRLGYLKWINKHVSKTIPKNLVSLKVENLWKLSNATCLLLFPLFCCGWEGREREEGRAHVTAGLPPSSRPVKQRMGVC